MTSAMRATRAEEELQRLAQEQSTHNRSLVRRQCIMAIKCSTLGVERAHFVTQ